MNKILSALALGALASTALASSAHAQASGSGTASGTVVSALTILQASGGALNFGTLTVGNLPGTLKVSVNGTNNVTATGGVVPVANTGAQYGTFNVMGAANVNYTVTVPSSAQPLSGPTAGNSFIPELTDAGTSTQLHTLSSAGTDTVKVGAVATFAANTQAGTYTGTYPITANY